MSTAQFPLNEQVYYLSEYNARFPLCKARVVSCEELPDGQFWYTLSNDITKYESELFYSAANCLGYHLIDKVRDLERKVYRLESEVDDLKRER